MKKYIISGLSLFFFLACSEKDELLLSNIEIVPNFNPETTILTGSEMMAWMKNDSTIEGFGGGYAFRSTDNFKNFTIQPGEIIGFPIYYNKEGVIVSGYYHNNSGIITNDYFTGAYRDITPFLDKYIAVPDIYYGEIQYPIFYFRNPNDGMIVSRFKKSHAAYEIEDGVKFYKLINGKPEPVSAVASNDYTPIDLEFFDENVGYTLLTEFNNSYPGYSKIMYLSKTEDGGNTWSEPERILKSNVIPQKISNMLLTGPNTIVLYSDKKINGTSHMFVSENGGGSWNTGFLPSDHINSIQFITSKIGYYVDDTQLNYHQYRKGNIYKTIDSGKTWNKINESDVYVNHVFFINETTGIAYTDNVLQITHDGGKTWELLIHPQN